MSRASSLIVGLSKETKRCHPSDDVKWCRGEKGSGEEERA